MKKTFSIILLLFIFTSLPSNGKNIKIGLKTNASIIIGSNTNSQLISLENNKSIADIPQNTNITMKALDGQILVVKDNVKLGIFLEPLKLKPKNSGYVKCNGIKYRGDLIIILNPLNKSEITVINDVDLEEYLLSVVPSEMPSAWHIEALKAQAVAARSYSLGYLGRRKEKGYDLEATIQDQVYKGISSEKPNSSKAVKETKGQILLDEYNSPLITFFHSSAGGYTDSIENIWGHKTDVKPSKHIQPKPDFDNKSPFYTWNRSISIEDINSKLNELEIGNFKKITFLKKSISGRVEKVKLLGDEDIKVINGEEFRMLLKLPSSRFSIVQKDDKYQINGKGYGHGLGLSQWGSKALAEKGHSYKEILAHYYNNAKLIVFESNIEK